MKLSKTLLASGVAMAALCGVANAAVTALNAVNYIAGGTAPATLVVNNGTASATLSHDMSGPGATVITAGNQITFTLSQGTFATAPSVSTSSGTTISLAAGGTGSNFITYNVVIAGASPTITVSNVQVAGVSTAVDGTVSLIVTSNAAGYNGITATNRTADLAVFSAGLSSTNSPIQVGVLASATSAGFAGGAASATAGSAAFSTPGGLLNYSNAAVTFGTATFALTFPFAAGSLSSAEVSGSCLATTTFAGTTGATALSGSISVPSSSLASFSTASGGCTVGLRVFDATATTAPVPAVGASSVVATFPITNVPGLTSVSATRSLGAFQYTGGRAIALGYAFGSDSSYQFFVSVNNTTSAAANVGFQSGAFSGVLSAPAGVNTLFSMDQIANALAASGAPISSFTGAGNRFPLTVLAPAGTQVVPLIRNGQTTIVNEIGSNLNQDAQTN